MPLNTFNLLPPEWEEPKIQGWCGPEHVAQFVIHFRRLNALRFGPQWNAPISEDGIYRLMALAYQASLLPEEGRFPRFRLMTGRFTQAESRYTTRFATPVELEGVEGLHALRRLAPVGSDHETFLLVMQDELTGVLRCKGIVITSDAEHISMGAQTGILTITVDGPASLRVGHTGMPVTYQLFQGAVRQIVHYQVVPAVRTFFDELEDMLIERAAQMKGEVARIFFQRYYDLSNLLLRTWSHVLKGALEARHGGAFVILPPQSDDTAIPIHCSNQMQLDFAGEILGLAMAGLDAWAAGGQRPDQPEELQHLSPLWIQRRSRLSRTVRALTALSSVDGCVVIDRNFKVRGFGGEIQILGDADALPFCDYNSHQPHPETELLKFGTRHRSACRFCQTNPGALVFVISQDAELRIFCSTDHCTYGFEGLDAWSRESEL